MSVPFWRRVGLVPRLAAVIALAMLATKALDMLLVAAVPPPRILFYTRDWLATEIRKAVEVAESVPAAGRDEALAALDHTWLAFRSSPEPPAGGSPSERSLPRIRDGVQAILGGTARQVVAFGTPLEDPEWETSAVSIVLPATPAAIENVLDDDFREDVIAASRMRIGVQLIDGTWLHVTEPGHSLTAVRKVRNAALWIGALLLVAGVALLAARSVIRPLRHLSDAADRLGRERELTPIPPAHVPEIDAIAESFNRMQERLKRFVDERTSMLAAIAHDLRTPLTRLRLFAESIGDAQARKLVLHDIDEMEQMIRASLTFAGEDARREPPAVVDVATLLISLCDTFADAGQHVRYEGPDHALLPCRAVAVRRALSNLIDNACKYGEQAHVTLEDSDDALVVAVTDRGPGIPPHLADQAFAPFRRLEGSRNRESGGVGLGLTIARDVIHQHGGAIELQPAGPEGFAVRVRLPKPRAG